MGSEPFQQRKPLCSGSSKTWSPEPELRLLQPCRQLAEGSSEEKAQADSTDSTDGRAVRQTSPGRTAQCPRHDEHTLAKEALLSGRNTHRLEQEPTEVTSENTTSGFLSSPLPQRRGCPAASQEEDTSPAGGQGLGLRGRPRQGPGPAVRSTCAPFPAPASTRRGRTETPPRPRARANTPRPPKG